jgi:hypothetical protein
MLGSSMSVVAAVIIAISIAFGAISRLVSVVAAIYDRAAVVAATVVAAGVPVVAVRAAFADTARKQASEP